MHAMILVGRAEGKITYHVEDIFAWEDNIKIDHK